MQEEEKEKDSENSRSVHCHLNGIPLDQPAQVAPSQAIPASSA
jgi:hypothetical protein